MSELLSEFRYLGPCLKIYRIATTKAYISMLNFFKNRKEPHLVSTKLFGVSVARFDKRVNHVAIKFSVIY